MGGMQQFIQMLMQAFGQGGGMQQGFGGQQIGSGYQNVGGTNPLMQFFQQMMGTQHGHPTTMPLQPMNDVGGATTQPLAVGHGAPGTAYTGGTPNFNEHIGAYNPTPPTHANAGAQGAASGGFNLGGGQWPMMGGTHTPNMGYKAF